MKKMFLRYGFHIVYDRDGDVPVADGFYFTVAYPGMTGPGLVEALLYFGISAISLSTTGSRQAGIRACVSFVLPEQFPELDSRLAAFRGHYPG